MLSTNSVSETGQVGTPLPAVFALVLLMFGGAASQELFRTESGSQQVRSMPRMRRGGLLAAGDFKWDGGAATSMIGWLRRCE